MPITAPGIASIAVSRCVSSWPGIVPPLMRMPPIAAPNRAPRNAPTIPPQKWSGRKIVKCQMARPIITQASIPMSAAPSVALVARALRLVALGLVVLEHEVLGVRIGGRVALVAVGRGRPRGRALDVQVAHHLLELALRDRAVRGLGLGDPAPA